MYALSRADFRLASYYAAPVLNADPNDVNANFGMAMNYYMTQQYALAEKHMGTCLRQNERQPAFWNNLAVIQMHLGRFGEARKNARRALELLPDSAEIKKTLSQIDEEEKKARAAAEKKAGKDASATPREKDRAAAPPKKEEGKAVAQPRPPANKGDAKKDDAKKDEKTVKKDVKKGAKPARPAKGAARSAKDGGKAKNGEGGK